MSDNASEILDLLEHFCRGLEPDKPSIRHLLERVLTNQEKSMSAVEDLVTQVGALKDELAALKTSNDGLVTAIDNWIANHQNSDDPKVVQAVADIQQAVADAKAVQAADDTEAGKLA